ncbi:MAG: hypothetical protein U5K30_03795 [Acidimicrobiales bacterium]|nr:hypothetical protein [Acidimicrobiales bacterium]
MTEHLPDRLDPDTAGAIIRRATEIDQARARPGGDGSGIDRTALEEAASEVGLSPASVRQALAEHDAGTLGPADGGYSILGPARTRSVRTVDLPLRQAQEQVTRWLKAQLLEVHRRSGDQIEWRRRDDLKAKMRRRVDPSKKVRLSGVDAVEASVVDDGKGRSIVRLDADLEHTRTGLWTGVIGVPTAAGPVLGGAAALVLADPVIFVAGFPVGLALGGTGFFLARRTLATELDEAQRVLDLFLEELDRGR